MDCVKTTVYSIAMISFRLPTLALACADHFVATVLSLVSAVSSSHTLSLWLGLAMGLVSGFNSDALGNNAVKGDTFENEVNSLFADRCNMSSQQFRASCDRASEPSAYSFLLWFCQHLVAWILSALLLSDHVRKGNSVTCEGRFSKPIFRKQRESIVR